MRLAPSSGDGRFLTHCRICPGKRFALRTLFLYITCTLTVFDISALVGEKLEVKYHEGFIRCAVISICYFSALCLWKHADAGLKAPTPVQVRDQALFCGEFETG